MSVVVTIAFYGLVTFVPHLHKPMTYALLASNEHSQHTNDHLQHYPLIAWGEGCRAKNIKPTSNCTVVALNGVDISFEPALSKAKGDHAWADSDLVPLLGDAAGDPSYSKVNDELVAPIGNGIEDSDRIAARLNLVNGKLLTEWDGRPAWWFRKLSAPDKTHEQMLAKRVEYEAEIQLDEESPVLTVIQRKLTDGTVLSSNRISPTNGKIRIFVINQPEVCEWIDKICELDHAPHFQMLYNLTESGAPSPLPIPFNRAMSALYCRDESLSMGCKPRAERIRGTGPIFCPVGRTAAFDYVQ